VACVSGSIEWGGWSGSARSPVLLLPSLNTLQTVITEHMLQSRMNIHWYCTCMMKQYLCLSFTEWHTVVQRPHRAVWLWHVPFMVGSDRCWNSTRTLDVTVHITRQYMLSAYLINNLYTLGPYIDCVHIQCVHIYAMSTYTLSVHLLCKLCPQIHIYIFQHTIPWW